MSEAEIRNAIRLVADFPVPGVGFFDIGPVIADRILFAQVVTALAEPFHAAGITHVLGIETRGLYFAGAVADRLGAGLVPVRKPGKLPRVVLGAKGEILDAVQVVGQAAFDPKSANTYRKTYEFEMAEGVIGPRASVLIIDDLLAKGGSVNACQQLVETSGAVIVGSAFVIELEKLGGRRNLPGIDVHSLVRF